MVDYVESDKRGPGPDGSESDGGVWKYRTESLDSTLPFMFILHP